MKSEYTALTEILTARGISGEQLAGEIKKAVLEKFQEAYPKSPADATVLVNEKSGDVMIFSGDKNITPPEFGQTAAQITRQVMISKIAETDGKPAAKPKPEAGKGPPGAISSVLANLFFWGYNIYFTLFNLSLLASFFSGNFIVSFVENLKNYGIFRLLFSVVLMLVPPGAMAVAIKRKLYSRPSALLQLFFLFEMPLAFACLLPITLIGQTTPFMMLICLALLCLPGIFYVYGSGATIPEHFQKPVYVIQQFVFIIGAYLGLLFAFWIPVVLGGIWETFFPDMGYMFSSSGYGMSPSSVIGSFLGMGIGLVILLLISGIVLTPYLLLMAVYKAMMRTRTALAQHLGRDALISLETISIVVILTVGAIACYQPSANRMFEPLRKLTTNRTFADKEKIAKELAPREKNLKQAISDISKSRSRYPLTKDSKTIKEAYHQVFKINETAAEVINSMYLAAAYPFVYQGERNDASQLATNFAYLFGYSPYSSTVKPATATVPSKNVWLTYRKITMTPEKGGLTAKIAIEEEYENSTNQQQEVLYEFTLPRGAVMTDLKLGPDLEFAGVIAPRGAAQRTYERQLQVRRDPALLEETGPRQYRLRVFPVPAKNDYSTLKGRRQKVRFEYATAAMPEGYPLPVITRKTNVYTTGGTQMYMVMDQNKLVVKEDDQYLPLSGLAKADFCSGNPAFADPEIMLLANLPEIKPAVCATVEELLNKISGLKIAVFVDVSVQNKDNNIQAQLNILGKSNQFLTNNQVDLIKFNDLKSEAVKLTPDNFQTETSPVFFGKSNGLTAINTFNQKYDLVLIVAQNTGFETTDTLAVAAPSQAYLIHTQLPPAYTMKFASKLLQTGGDATNSLLDALRLYSLSQTLAGKYSQGGYLINQYTGAVFTGQTIDGLTPVEGADMATAALINKAIYRTAINKQMGDISGNVNLLDKLNAFAQKARVVTVYSSLISLVNQLQQQQLDQLSQQYNRYQDQQLTQQQQNIARPMFEETSPTFSPLRSFNPLDSLFGVDLIQMDLKSTGDSGGGTSFMGGVTDTASIALTTPSPSTRFGTYGAGGLSSILGGGSLFIIANGVLLITGLGIYVVRLLKKKQN